MFYEDNAMKQTKAQKVKGFLKQFVHKGLQVERNLRPYLVILLASALERI